MTDESPAEKFDRYLREVEEQSEPLPTRLDPSWSDRAILALMAAGGIALLGWVGYGAVRLVGLLP